MGCGNGVVEEYRKKQLHVSSMVEEDGLDVELRKIGASFSGEEKYLKIVMEKELGGKGLPEYYLLRYDSEKKKTDLIHLGSQLGEDARDVEVHSTDPYTAIESFEKMGFQQILQQELVERVWHYKGLEVRVEKSEGYPLFIEIGKEVTSRHEEERVVKIVGEFYEALGVAKENLFQGSVLQYMLQFIAAQAQQDGVKEQEGKGMDSTREASEGVYSLEEGEEEPESGDGDEGDDDENGGEGNKPLF